MKKVWCWETKIELRDMWVGLYVDVKEIPPPHRLHFYICPLPCCLLHIWQENLPE
jgi:hypothetical protein